MRGVTIFLSAPSARRATRPFGVAVDDQIISIHALREEGDTTGKVDTPEFKIFLSTPSARRATNRIAF